MSASVQGQGQASTPASANRGNGVETTPSSTSSASTSSILLSTLSAYSTLTQRLFASIENPSLRPAEVVDTASNRKWTASTTSDVISSLQEVDSILTSHLKLARQHASNQYRIESLKRKAKAQDRRSKQAILELSRMKTELDDLIRISAEEVKSIEKAESNPIGHTTLLSYAQRLARYTSAPPGYRLPKIAQQQTEPAGQGAGQEGVGGSGEVKAEAGELGASEASAEKLTLGPDYNQLAKKAAAYYDPAMPSMPQEMPFPSDAMMRQGILNSQELLGGAQAAEAPAEDGLEEEEMEEEYIPAYSQLHQQQQLQRQEEEEQAFDLDLN